MIDCVLFIGNYNEIWSYKLVIPFIDHTTNRAWFDGLFSILL